MSEPPRTNPSVSLKHNCLFQTFYRKPADPYLHPKGLHPDGHLSPDSAQAKNSQGLSIQLGAHELQPNRQRSQSQHQERTSGRARLGGGKAGCSPSSAPICHPSSKPSPGESACKDTHRFSQPTQTPASSRRRDMTCARPPPLRVMIQAQPGSGAQVQNHRKGSRCAAEGNPWQDLTWSPGMPVSSWESVKRFHFSLWGIRVTLGTENAIACPPGFAGISKVVLRDADGITCSRNSRIFIFLFRPGSQTTSTVSGDS